MSLKRFALVSPSPPDLNFVWKISRSLRNGQFFKAGNLKYFSLSVVVDDYQFLLLMLVTATIETQEPIFPCEKIKYKCERSVNQLS